MKRLQSEKAKIQKSRERQLSLRPCCNVLRLATTSQVLENTLTSSNRRSENIRIFAVIIAELKLRNIERHIFGADFVEASDDPAFENRPKALNRVRVDCADNVLPNAVIDRAMRVIGQPVIDAALIGREQANLVRDGFANEGFCGLLGDVLQDASDDATLAAGCAGDLPLSK